MSIDQTAEVILENLSQEYIDALIQRVCDMMANHARKTIADIDIRNQIHTLIEDSVDRAVSAYFWPDNNTVPNLDVGIVETLGTEFKSRTDQFLTHLTDRIQNDVIRDIRNFISTTDFVEFVNTTAATAIKNTVEQSSYQFPTHSIPASAVRTNEIIISANQIDGGTIKRFASTGIEDRALERKLIIENDRVVIAGDIEIQGQVNAAFMDNIVTQAANIILNKMPEGTFAFDTVTAEDVVHLVVAHVRKKFEVDISQAVSQEVAAYGIRGSLENKIDNIIKQCVDTYVYNTPDNTSHYENTVVSGLISSFNTQTEQFVTNLRNTVQKNVLDTLSHAVSQINIIEEIKAQSGRILYDLVARNGISFPDRSVPGSAIDTASLSISGDNINGGVIRNFQSLGIQDRANQCQVTVTDNYTVIENKLVANSLEIRGPVNFVNGLDQSITDQLSELTLAKLESKNQQGLYDQYAQRVFDKIQEQGISIDHLQLQGKPLFDNGTLSYNVTKSNLQRVGYLKELQVQGESYLSSTLYTSGKRAGINTLEPEATLDLWDQEVQIVAGKRSQDVGMIGSPRNQTLLVTTNNKNQLSINPDGSVTADQLNIGRVRHTSSPIMPVDNRPAGVVVWNERPFIGGPIGWVSLGGARWAGFGTVTE